MFEKISSFEDIDTSAGDKTILILDQKSNIVVFSGEVCQDGEAYNLGQGKYAKLYELRYVCVPSPEWKPN